MRVPDLPGVADLHENERLKAAAVDVTAVDARLQGVLRRHARDTSAVEHMHREVAMFELKVFEPFSSGPMW